MKKFLLLVLSIFIVAGCSTDYEILRSQGTLSLQADSSVKRAGETITFTVNYNNIDVTDEAVIMVDGTTISGNAFTSEVVGTFEVKATYGGLETETEVRFHDGSEINYVKRVLIEDYTGTWCGYCPRVAHAIELAKAQTDKIVAVAIHRPSSVPTSSVYDPYNFDASELEATLGPGSEGYPKGFLNRKTQWSFPEPDNVGQVIALTQGENPKLGLAISSTVSNGNISMEVSTQFARDFSNLKLVVYVLENGLIYDQHNYTIYYNDADIIEDFEHNHTLRATLTPLLGEAISNTETVTGNTYTRTFNVAIPANVANADNIEFVAFIVDETGKAINVRQALPNVTQDFEEL